MSAGRAQRRRLARNRNRWRRDDAIAVTLAEAPLHGCTCGGTFKRLLHRADATIVVVGHDADCPIPRGWRPCG